MKRVAILGCAGIPANYGGYETLAQNLVERKQREEIKYVVYCSSLAYPVKLKEYCGARLVYCPFKANGWQSPIYDALTYIHAYFACDTIVTLSSVGSFVLPFLRIFGKRRIIANYDGVELNRNKWNFLSRMVIKICQKCTSWFASLHIADNSAMVPILKETYGIESTVIEYGGDNAYPVKDDTTLRSRYHLEPKSYYFNVARIEPENNTDKILSAFEKLPDKQLVLVGNWRKNDYAKVLYQRYSNTPNIKLIDPIYEPNEINLLRSNCQVYIHPHSVGGTNPSLVEAMSLGLPIIAFDVIFNRTTTENRALYFKTADAMIETIRTLRDEQLPALGINMAEIAQRRYRWATIVSKYEELY